MISRCPVCLKLPRPSLNLQNHHVHTPWVLPGCGQLVVLILTDRPLSITSSHRRQSLGISVSQIVISEEGIWFSYGKVAGRSPQARAHVTDNFQGLEKEV